MPTKSLDSSVDSSGVILDSSLDGSTSLLRPEVVMLIGRIGGAALNLLTVTVVAKLAGVETYGAYSLCLAIAALSITGCFTWNRQAFVRNFYLAKSEESMPELDRFASFSFFGSAIVAAVVTYVSSLILVPDLSQMARAMILLLVAGKAAFDLQVERERISERFVSSAARALSRPVLFLLILYFIPSKHVTLLLGSLTLAFVLPSIAPMLAMVRSGFNSKSPTSSFPMAGMLWIWLPMSFSLVLDVINHQSSRFYLNHFWGLTSVGHYSITADLIRQGLVAFFTVIASLQIQRLQKAEAEQSLNKHSIRRFLMLTLYISLAIWGIGSLLSPTFFALVFPDTRATVSNSFLAMIVGCGVLSSLKMAFFDGLLVLFNRQRDVLAGSVIMVLVAQVANFLLVPRWGLSGAATAMLISYAVGASYALWSALAAKPHFEKQHIA
jgi:O-antigen/teichoic acid export membrane protein